MNTILKFAMAQVTMLRLDRKRWDPPANDTYRHDILSDKIGGGVALCINNNISYCRRHDLKPQHAQEEIVV